MRSGRSPSAPGPSAMGKDTGPASPSWPPASGPGRSDDAVAPESVELRLAAAEERAVHLRVVLAEEGRPYHLGGRRREADRAARYRHPSAHGMVDVDDHAAPAKVLVRQDLGGVEDGAARDTGPRERLHHVMLRAFLRPPLDERVELVDPGPPAVAVGEARVVGELRLPDRPRQRLPHVAVGHVDEDVVVRAERAAAIEIRRRRRGRAVPATRDGARPEIVVAEVDAGEIDDDILLGDLDALPHARRVPLNESGEDADRRVEAGAGVAETGLGADRRSVRCAGEAHDAPHRLGDHLEAVVTGVGAVTAEALDRGGDDARVDP